MMRTASCFLIFVMSVLLPTGVDAGIPIGRDKVSSTLAMFDDSLRQRNSYIAARQRRIDVLVDSLRHTPGDLDIVMRIADQYASFNNDSALYYYDKGIDASQGMARLPFAIKRAALLPLSGMFSQAQSEFNSIDTAAIPSDLLPLYYDSGRQLYSYLNAFFSNYPEVSQTYGDKALELQRRLLQVLPPQSTAYKFNLGEYRFLTGDYARADALLNELIEDEPYNSNLRARATHHLSSIAHAGGDTEAYIYYLTLSALADVTSATREVVSLQELGRTMYDYGDLERSYNYLSTALATAVECGAPLRMIESSRILPVIEQANSDHIRSWRRTMYIVMAIMALLVIGLLVTLLFLRHEMHRMATLQNNLRNANKVKEVYISQFLNLCSIYMDKLNQFCKIANRKITAGKVDDLYRMTKSGKFVEEQSREFYDVFDDAFLHIYPTFVDEVNKLLRPDAQIELKGGEMLNTDLRILAFMRLGIDDSARIAQVLNYSLNTIYSYRNRAKARAISRETFEADVMKISSVS